MIDPNTIVTSVLKKNQFSISYPFISTPHFSFNNISDIYYDPKSFLLPGLNAVQGVPVISGRADLKNWFSSPFSN